MSRVTPETAVARDLCRHDFYFFTRWLFQARKGFPWIKAGHHALIAAALERVFRGESRRLIINVPPRSGKTEMVVINFMAWAMGQVPDSEFIHASYSARLATNNSWQTRELCLHEEYQAIFPGCVLRTDSKAKDEWRTTAGGCVYAVGAGGSITGYGAGKYRDTWGGALILDDLHKADEARSDVIREHVLEWFQNTLESRKNSPDTPIILIMQRLHERDIAGWLLDGGNGETWEHVNCPAITAEGESLWPEKWSLDELRRMEQANPYVFAGQYLQRPAPPEGGLIKPDALVPVDALPAGVTQWVRGWDFGATTAGDYTAGAKLGRLADGRFVIADLVRLRVGPDERDAALRNTAARDGLTCTVSIPQDPGQAGLTQAKYLVRELAGYHVKASPESGDKVTRAGPLAAQINVGNVLLLKAPWNDGLISEMRLFPNGAYDDQVDALSRAFMELVGNAPVEVFIPDGTVEQDKRGAPTCGRCAHFVGSACQERGFGTRAEAAACDGYLPRLVPLDEPVGAE